jgi:hypothetical protein
MPFMDGTGPLGDGPGSGKGRGMCAGAQGGLGQGMGRGGRGNGCGANGPSRDQKAVLGKKASFMERQLDRIKRPLSGLAGEQPSK